MALTVGIVGMPNAGKSSLFNLITGLSVPAENYPFNTIEPNIGIVAVKDKRIEALSKLVNPKKTTYPQIEFHDIAGLVKGASKGEGLGNKFLANIREVDLILIVVRGFRGNNVQHTLGTIDPARDIEVLHSELILKDIETVTKRLSTLNSNAQKEQHDFFAKLLAKLNAGELAGDYAVGKEDVWQVEFDSLQLLTAKRFVYLFNTDEFTLDQEELLRSLGLKRDDVALSMDVQLEMEIVNSGSMESASDFGISEMGIDKLIRACFYALNYEMFLTAGPQEVRGWPYPKGALSPQAAAVIHTDFEKKFIAAEIVNLEDYLTLGSWEALKEKGKVKLAGRDYVMKDGDVVYFRIGA